MRHAIDVEPILFDVLHNSHNGHPRQAGLLSEAKPTTERITIAPVAPGCGFIDDGNQLFAIFVAFGKKAPTHQRSLHHSEIIRTYLDHLGP